ncbi:unnamed protein product [Discosporangium mesarthrocarpum]
MLAARKKLTIILHMIVALFTAAIVYIILCYAFMFDTATARCWVLTCGISILIDFTVQIPVLIILKGGLRGVQIQELKPPEFSALRKRQQAYERQWIT